jgi:hypothetical protein
MPLSPDLWDSVVPPAVWITIHPLAHPESDSIDLLVRVKEEGKRSVTAKATVSRYAATSQVALAASRAIAQLETAQQPLTTERLSLALLASVRAWVDPF